MLCNIWFILMGTLLRRTQGMSSSLLILPRMRYWYIMVFMSFDHDISPVLEYILYVWSHFYSLTSIKTFRSSLEILQQFGWSRDVHLKRSSWSSDLYLVLIDSMEGVGRHPLFQEKPTWFIKFSRIAKGLKVLSIYKEAHNMFYLSLYYIF